VQQLDLVLDRSAIAEERLIDLGPVDGERVVTGAIGPQPAAVFVNVFVVLLLVRVPDAPVAVVLGGRRKTSGAELGRQVGPREVAPLLLVDQGGAGPAAHQVRLGLRRLAQQGRDFFIGQGAAIEPHVLQRAAESPLAGLQRAEVQRRVGLRHAALRRGARLQLAVHEELDLQAIVSARVVRPDAARRHGHVGMRVLVRLVLDQHAHAAVVEVERELLVGGPPADQHLGAVHRTRPDPGSHREGLGVEGRAVLDDAIGEGAGKVHSLPWRLHRDHRRPHNEPQKGSRQHCAHHHHDNPLDNLA